MRSDLFIIFYAFELKTRLDFLLLFSFFIGGDFFLYFFFFFGDNSYLSFVLNKMKSSGLGPTFLFLFFYSTNFLSYFSCLTIFRLITGKVLKILLFVD